MDIFSEPLTYKSGFFDAIPSPLLVQENQGFHAAQEDPENRDTRDLGRHRLKTIIGVTEQASVSAAKWGVG